MSARADAQQRTVIRERSEEASQREYSCAAYMDEQHAFHVVHSSSEKISREVEGWLRREFMILPGVGVCAAWRGNSLSDAGNIALACINDIRHQGPAYRIQDLEPDKPVSLIAWSESHGLWKAVLECLPSLSKASTLAKWVGALAAWTFCNQSWPTESELTDSLDGSADSDLLIRSSLWQVLRMSSMEHEEKSERPTLSRRTSADWSASLDIAESIKIMRAHRDRLPDEAQVALDRLVSRIESQSTSVEPSRPVMSAISDLRSISQSTTRKAASGILASLVGRSFTFEENKLVCQEINAALRRIGFRVECCSCPSAPALLRCRKVPRMREGSFQFEHSEELTGRKGIVRRRTYHGGTANIPELRMIPAPKTSAARDTQVIPDNCDS